MTIYVVGNVAVDETFRVASLPGPGTSILAWGRSRDLGGKGANQAVVLARAGLDVHLLAGIGNDDAASWIRRELAREGLGTAGLTEVECASDMSVILVDDRAENLIVTTCLATASVNPTMVEQTLQAAGPGDTLLIQGNLDPGFTRLVLENARRRALATVFNPSPVHPAFRGLWCLADIVVLNEGEAAELTGMAADAAAREILAGGASHVVVTLGAQGALLFNRHGLQRISAAPAAPVDTTGAGDTFAAVLVAASVLLGEPNSAAVRAAAAAAAITVSRPGTRSAFPQPDEIKAILGRL